MSLLKSILHNIGVTIVSFGVGAAGRLLDFWFRFSTFQSAFSITAGAALLLIGFCIRVWAAYLFYAHDMKVIVLKPQGTLITSGPYRFSRNPLYLGGNVFMFFGAAIILGSPSGVFLTIIGIFITDFFIRREERQLASAFGEEWERYKKSVRRWV